MIICFGSITSYLGAGFLFVHHPITALFNGEKIFGSVYYLSVMVIGVLGLVGAASILVKILFPNINVISKNKILTFMSMAVFIVIFQIAFNLNELALWWQLAIALVVLPIIGSVHLMYLGRDYLFHKNS